MTGLLLSIRINETYKGELSTMPKERPREFWTQCGDKARMLGLESAGITEGEAVFGSTNGDAV